MCILKVAIYILAALATSELSHQANAASSFNLSTNNKTATPIVKAEEQKSTKAEDSLRLHKAALLHPRSSVPMQVSARASDLLAQATTFSDIQSNWAQTFIQALAARNIIQGFPDGSFRPDEPVTRAQFAAMVRQAFQQNPVREAIAFVDVPEYYWASEAIQEAYQTGFLAGYPNNVFNPNQNIPRVQVLVSLANGLNLAATTDAADVLERSFQDAAQIPEFARTPVAAATANRLVVNYPDVALLNPDQVATRADVAAFIYQALASTGQVPPVSATDVAAQYIVGYEPVAEAPSTPPPEQVADLREQFRLPVPTLIEVVRTGAFGGTTIGSPSAFGADFGEAFAGISFQSRARNTDRSDGAASVGFGLGDARRSVGLEVAVSVVDLLDETFQDGTVSFKAHRLLSNSFGVAVGVENAVIWGDTDGGTSAYGVASKVFRLRNNPDEPLSRFTATLGIGSGRFRSEDDIEDDEDTINVFGSVSVQAIRNVSVIADWTGQDLNLGVSVVPFRGLPLVITPGVADVTGSAGDGARFILGVGYGFSF